MFIDSKKEVIERLCKLASYVAAQHGWRIASDCFCHQSGTEEYDGFRVDEETIEFIEQAVNEKLRGLN